MNFKCLSIFIFKYVFVSGMVQNFLQTLNLSLVSTWECHSCHRQTIFPKKHVQTGLFLPHLDSAVQKQILIDTTYNEQLRPRILYLFHLIHITSYKLCLVIWTPPFSLILTSNVCILLQSLQTMDTYLFHNRQGHLAFASQLPKTFSAQINTFS